MNPSSCSMTGSRTALSSSSIGRASPGRHGRPKRRRLDVTTPTSPGRRRAGGGGGGGEQQTDDHHDDDAGAVRGVEGASSASSATCWPHHNGRDERARVRPAPPWPREPCWPGSHGDEESWWPLGVPVGLPAAWGSDAPTPVASGQPQPTPSTVVPSGQPQPTAPSTAEVTTAPPTAASTVGNVGCWTLTASEESAQHGQQAQHEQYGQLGQHGQLGQLELYGQHGQHGQQGQLGQNGQQTQLSQLGQHGQQGQHEQYGQQGQLGQRGLPTAQLGQLGQHGQQGQQGQQGEDSDGSYSSQDSAGDQSGEPGWSQLPAELLVGVFRLLRLRDLGRVAQVCRAWRRASQEPCLWRTAEFALGSSLRPEPTPPALVNFILERHAQHLRFVVLRTDSSAESTRGACRILARLVKCSLRTLALMSGARALDPDEQRLVSALTLVLGHSSPSLRALAVDHTLVDDPSLQALGSSSAASLQLLRCKGCPRLSPGGVLALVDHCRCLRELSLSYTLLSDDLLNALSSERHVCLEVLRVDVYTDSDSTLRPISPSSWRALVAHSPQLNLVMYLFAIQDEHFDNLFTSYIPVTHLYFGDYVPTSVLGRIGEFCPRLVELVVGANGNSVIDRQLLDIASNCQQLTSLGLAECQVTCSALVCLAERCGARLAHLVVMEECLIEDSAHDLASACARVSQLLGRDWSPEFMPMW